MKVFIRSNIEIIKLKNKWDDKLLCEATNIDIKVLKKIRNTRSMIVEVQEFAAAIGEKTETLMYVDISLPHNLQQVSQQDERNAYIRKICANGIEGWNVCEIENVAPFCLKPHENVTKRSYHSPVAIFYNAAESLYIYETTYDSMLYTYRLDGLIERFLGFTFDIADLVDKLNKHWDIDREKI